MRSLQTLFSAATGEALTPVFGLSSRSNRAGPRPRTYPCPRAADSGGRFRQDGEEKAGWCQLRRQGRRRLGGGRAGRRSSGSIGFLADAGGRGDDESLRARSGVGGPREEVTVGGPGDGAGATVEAIAAAMAPDGTARRADDPTWLRLQRLVAGGVQALEHASLIRAQVHTGRWAPSTTPRPGSGRTVLAAGAVAGWSAGGEGIWPTIAPP